MKPSSSVYPANVLGDTQNRQQIATVLQSMGFETDDIAKAFNVFEKSYGDKKYDISLLTEIVFQIQQNENAYTQYDHDEYKDDKTDNNNLRKSYSVPNSPKPPQPNEQILHYQNLNKNTLITQNNNNNNNNNDMLSIFNSLQMNDNNNNNNNTNRIKSTKASSASPLLHSKRISTNYKTAKLNLLDCLGSFKKYASSENEIIEVLLQTLNSNDNDDDNDHDHDNDVFNNMNNWNDLFNNIKQRKYEWNKFKKSYNSNVIFTDYDQQKHIKIRNNLNNHKANKTENNYNDTDMGGHGDNNSDNKNGESMLQKALQFQYDLKNMDLLHKKDKLLITANTYSILKNNKEKTELMIQKCNEKMYELDVKMQQLQNEKKQYFSALMRTKNKLLFQIESIRETENSIKQLHEETSKIQNEISEINQTKKCVDKFENELNTITSLLKYNFNKRLEPTWIKWSNNDVIIWIKHIENEKYEKSNYHNQIQQSGLCGKDLPEMNDFILRSFKVTHKNDRDLILKNIKRIIQLKEYKRKNKNKNKNKNRNNNNNNNSKPNKKSQLCVVCSDGEANHIMIPCGHIAVCSNCVQQVKQYKKCAFCGNKITNIIKCFHVGF